MIEDLVDVVDRSWAALEKRAGVSFVWSCFPFKEHLSRDTRTAQILEDLRCENGTSLNDLVAAIAAARAALLAIFGEFEGKHPRLVPVSHNEHEPDLTGATIRRSLQPRQPDPDDDEWIIARENEDDRVLHIARAVREMINKADAHDLRVRVDIIEQQIQYARRKYRIHVQTTAGAALARIERDLADLHPAVNDPSSNDNLARLCRVNNRPLGRIYNILFENEPIPGHGRPAQEVDAAIESLRSDMYRLYEETRRRLGAERSLLSLVLRYRQKCQWYDAERLRQIASDGSGTSEDRLSETLATYLFDHGLNPLTRPLVGRISPDILDANDRFSFYVEAKQYTASAPGYLLRGMQQVWDMLDQLHGTGYDVQEAFYVIYRRGGPRYSFPPRVSHKGRVVHVVMVDIAETRERGSSAPPTRAFELLDLMPGAAISADTAAGEQ